MIKGGQNVAEVYNVNPVQLGKKVQKQHPNLNQSKYNQIAPASQTFFKENTKNKLIANKGWPQLKKKGNNMYVSPYSKNNKAKQAHNEVNYATADEQHQMEYGG